MKKSPDQSNLIMVYSTEILYGPNEKKPTGYYDYILTHMKVHTVEPRNPAPLLRQMEKARRSNKPLKACTQDVEILDEDSIIAGFDLLPDQIPEIQKLKERAIKENLILRVWMPKKGLPLFPAEDLHEFIKAHPEFLKKGTIDKKKYNSRI